MKGLDELRHKESDRINSISVNLKKVGVDVKVEHDDMYIHGKKLNIKKELKIKSFNDHRIAMSFLILNLICNKKLKVDNKMYFNKLSRF